MDFTKGGTGGIPLNKGWAGRVNGESSTTVQNNFNLKSQKKLGRIPKKEGGGKHGSEDHYRSEGEEGKGI